MEVLTDLELSQARSHNNMQVKLERKTAEAAEDIRSEMRKQRRG